MNLLKKLLMMLCKQTSCVARAIDVKANFYNVNIKCYNAIYI